MLRRQPDAAMIQRHFRRREKRPPRGSCLSSSNPDLEGTEGIPLYSEDSRGKRGRIECAILEPANTSVFPNGATGPLDPDTTPPSDDCFPQLHASRVLDPALRIEGVTAYLVVLNKSPLRIQFRPPIVMNHTRQGAAEEA